MRQKSAPSWTAQKFSVDCSSSWFSRTMSSDGTPHSPLCLSFMPLSRGHITLHGEEGNRDVLGSLWVSRTQVVCVRKR